MQGDSSSEAMFLKEPGSQEAATREAHCLDVVAGPGIVALKNVTTDGGLALSLAACSLADVLAERGPLSESEVRAVAVAAASALARVHARGLVHGDLKPSNLLLSPQGALWLADFDSAAPADGKPLESYSPGRSPPGAPARPQTDLAALAVTLVELATGQLVDPAVAWRSADLRRLGCPSGLSADIALLMGASQASAPCFATAEGAVTMFDRGELASLPAPAVDARRSDPTITVDFTLRPRAGTSRVAEAAEEAAAVAAPAIAGAWWRRLAESWRRDGTAP